MERWRGPCTACLLLLLRPQPLEKTQAQAGAALGAASAGSPRPPGCPQGSGSGDSRGSGPLLNPFARPSRPRVRPALHAAAATSRNARETFCPRKLPPFPRGAEARARAEPPFPSPAER